MTPSELKYQYQCHNPDGYFFDRKSMAFFGDTMSNYGCRSVSILASFDDQGKYHKEGILREAWELYRKHPVKNRNKSSTYFDKVTFTVIHSII